MLWCHKTAKESGFTWFEMMVALLVMVILIMLGLQQYNKYLSKTRLVEAIVMLGSFRQEIFTDYHSRTALPEAIQGALSGTGAGSDNVHESLQAIAAENSSAVDHYWYYRDKATGVGWVGVQLKRETIRPCDDKCQLHLGFREVKGEIRFWCGVWDTTLDIASYPYSILPTGCRESCVSCQVTDAVEESRHAVDGVME
jgi:Tfp pilus assembly major pilin PilA